MAKQVPDYSLYLVTDSTPAILGKADIVDVVTAAMDGGVTIVQYRDKTSDTATLISTARRLHTVTRTYRIPLLINDRVDVALAVGCEGVHVGQDDLDLPTVRRLLGPEAIIGVTVSTVSEAVQACAEGADYLGIGTMFATSTKTDSKSIIGTSGTQEILTAVASIGKHVKTVSIGGINTTNVQRVLYQSSSLHKRLDGIAVVSTIMGATEPKAAAQTLKQLSKSPASFVASTLSYAQRKFAPIDLIAQIPDVLKNLNTKNPLTHNMTNTVVQSFAANTALAIGASPIMSLNGSEASDLAELDGALVINMGTVTSEGLSNYCAALTAYNMRGGPVIFDPVGAGATSLRREAVKKLMASGYFDVIKGNEGEIRTVLGTGETVQQKGVDGGSSTIDDVQKAYMVSNLAAREKNIVVMTGAQDYISDAVRTYEVDNGHRLLGKITGSGCVLGTIISAMAAVERGDKLLAALAAVLLMGIAAERAAERESVRGPGTFAPALVDELYRICNETMEGDVRWLERARVRGPINTEA